MATFVKVCEALDKQGVKLNEITYEGQENGKRIYKTLEDIQKEYYDIVDIEKIIEETGVTLNYSIGIEKKYARNLLARFRKGTLNIRDKESLERLIELGVISIEKESAMEIFVRVCEALDKQGVELNEITYSSRPNNGKTIFKTLADIKEECHIDMDKVMEETGVTLDYPIGSQRKYAVILLAKSSKGTLDKELLKRLIELGVISIEKESAMETFVKVCKALKKQNFPFDKFTYTKQENGKTIKKTLKDIKKEYSYIDINKVIEETGVMLNYSIGSKRKYAMILLAKANKGMLDAKTIKLLERLIKLGVITDKKNNLKQFRKKRDDAGEKNKKVKELEERTKKQLSKRGKAHEEQ